MAETKPGTAVATNRKAYHDSFIEETLDAGMAEGENNCTMKIERDIFDFHGILLP